jgi:ketosteroid isomerase-like protein
VLTRNVTGPTEREFGNPQIEGARVSMRIKPLHYLTASMMVFVGIVFSVEVQGQSKQSKDESALTELVSQVFNAQSKFDPATLEKSYASDFIEISPVGEVDNREKAISFYKPEANPEGSKVKITVTADEFVIRTYRDFAVVIARISFAQPETSARPPVRLRVTLSCRKSNGAWKIVSAQYTGIRSTPRRP